MVDYIKPAACDTGACVEVGYVPPEGCTGGVCVEVGVYNGTVLFRDTAGMVCTYTPEEFAAFITAAKNGQYDHWCG